MRTLQQAHTYISLLWINMCIYGVPLSLSSDTFAYVSDKDDTVDNIIFAYYAYECHKFNCLYIYEAFLDWSYDSPNRQFSQSSRLLFVGNIEQKDIMKYTITAWTYTVNIQKIFGVLLGRNWAFLTLRTNIMCTKCYRLSLSLSLICYYYYSSPGLIEETYHVNGLRNDFIVACCYIMECVAHVVVYPIFLPTFWNGRWYIQRLQESWVFGSTVKWTHRMCMCIHFHGPWNLTGVFIEYLIVSAAFFSILICFRLIRADDRRPRMGSNILYFFRFIQFLKTCS